MAINVPFGGWANNQAQGGKNMRYWGGNVWTMGEDPTGGAGPNWQSGGSVAATPAPTDNYRDVLSGLMADREAKNAQLQSEYEKSATNISNELGIPGLNTQLSGMRGEVSKVQDLLSRLEGDINTRTSGQLLSESQRRRLLASEETPLRTQLGQLTTGENVAAGQLSQAYTELDRQLTPLLKKITSGQALSQDEWSFASQLAINEAQNKAALELERAKTAATISTNTPNYYTTPGAEGKSSPLSSITEVKPTSKLGPVSAISPGGQWMWDFSTLSWVPRVA